MNVVAFAARALLVVIFAFAAAGKLVDRAGARRALRGFRVPEALVQPVSWILPVSEFAVAVTLLVQHIARGAAVAAAVLLGLFMAGIVAAMRRGEAPECNCFGQIGSKPVGTATLWRNTALALPAAFVAIYGPGVNPGTWFERGAGTEITVLLLSTLAVMMTAVLVGLINDRRNMRADLTRAEATLALFPSGLPAGVVAPDFSLPATDGTRVTLADLLSRGQPIALTFVSPSCMPCRYMFPDIAVWQRSLSDRLTIALIVHGTIAEARALEASFGLTNLLADPDSDVFRDYRGSATPSMLIIGADGLIVSRIRSSQGVVEAAIRTALKQTTAGPRPVGEPPTIQVEHLPGRDVQQPA